VLFVPGQYLCCSLYQHICYCDSLNNNNKLVSCFPLIIIIINVCAVSLLWYSGGIVNWTQAELHKLDVNTRKLLTIMHGGFCMNSVCQERKVVEVLSLLHLL